MDVKKAIEDKNAGFKKAFDRGDAAGGVAFFTEDALLLPPHQKMLRGRQAIQEVVQGWIDHMGGTISNPMVEYGVDGDLAFQVATYAFENPKAPDQGKFVEIFRRQPDGSWKVYLTIYNSDQPL